MSPWWWVLVGLGWLIASVALGLLLGALIRNNPSALQGHLDAEPPIAQDVSCPRCGARGVPGQRQGDHDQVCPQDVGRWRE